ncbi:Saccharopine dehydrogenase [Nadsonia fulvescens var. elongata DSM 6958]|uniref:Saccharopine dehydrogenase [NADP(+), L-glutamate-forming] n=1 Tax=Nadsonia fulvescens var. elongata DSM 6958 TaxID=857566 RepID=A0A1E3PMQ8_9ASCO|nr:Saccharopine dehydrogenase [Nadsonia fulvescens var. elongata DSM 6958]
MSVKRVLLLGSGFVAKPTVDVLAGTEGIEVTVACRTLSSAQALAGQNAKAISVDVTDAASLDAAVGQHDLVISLIPYTFHADVIKSAIRQKCHVVTTSYVSPAMMELDQAAKDAGIVVMNEIGLDPGIDHLYAIKTIDEVHKAGGKIKSFLSYCGGLPSPEDSDNPLGYKFSWSSRGVLLALRNSAKYYKDGKVEEIEGEALMKTALPYFIYPGYAFVAYPNRDSTPYKERYNIPEADTIIRGTLRYQGFPEFIKVLVDIGFLSDAEVEYLKPSAAPIAWNTALAKLLNIESTQEADLIEAIVAKTIFKSEADKDRIINGLRWLGLFTNTPITPRSTPLDTLCATLEQLMQFGEKERDMVMLQHKFGIEWADGKTETRTSTMVAYGEVGGYSAMAKTVGVPCAVAVKQVLNGTIATPGVLAPMSWDICEPLIKELKEVYDIELIEKTL